MKICLTCDKELSGRQQKYCSDKCRMVVVNAKFQNYKNQKERGFFKKYNAVLRKGGCCQVCGYKKNLSALCFHHLDPKQKSFELDFRGFANRKEEVVEEELKKCVLLCHNCHTEEHNPDFNLVDAPGFEPRFRGNLPLTKV